MELFFYNIEIRTITTTNSTQAITCGAKPIATHSKIEISSNIFVLLDQIYLRIITNTNYNYKSLRIEVTVLV